ncbi:MAG TPA: phosphoribosylamine--glycine ligase [Bacteroidota bacterium]|jgi:phosphoribosylamine--glycine ligase|nr:phosphoribosylamine--glycine ligase [Bacteroidota bacterium]
MNILVIGSGGREHALAWKIRQSPLTTRLYCAPGNAGIEEMAEPVPIAATDLDGLLNFAVRNEIDLTVVGPEQPLTQGIVDVFEARGLEIFGPSKAAAKIEGSKVFAKQFMRKYNIPTAEFRTFNVAARFDAERFISETPEPIVIKADGLAAGKGVAVCETKEQALEVLRKMMTERVFGDAGLTVVIEEFLVGEEATVLAIADGKDSVTLTAAQDHKRIFDNDMGKNTGGMGSYAPAPVIDDELLERVKRTIIRPTLLGMAQEGAPYHGCLYIGLMITETGPKVVEFNCRFGDPETQVVLPLLDYDLVQLMLDAAHGNLGSTKIKLKNQTAVCVVIGSAGYPDEYETGKEIFGLEAAAGRRDVMVFHAGTRREKEKILTSGGRVLGVTAIGGKDDLEGTIDGAYRVVQKLTFDNMYYRSDIGRKGVERLRKLGALEPK